ILFPVSLSLRTTAAGVRLCPEPVAEIESLYQQSWTWQNETVAPGSNLTSAVSGECLRIQAVLQPQGASSCSFVIGNVPVTYDFTTAQLSCSGQSAIVALSNDQIKLDIIVDRMSLEIFADDGQIYMPVRANLTTAPDTLKLDSVGGNTQVVELTVNRLSSVWSNQ
ncbi:MAG: GH32 C-terminal domain-containing protein, partial [Sedimentisphaerales bacterium]|nr:GH32 C-terminal domain-containing protein [Sedimentisphaerales bacterium]